MKLIIAGGRNYHFSGKDIAHLDAINARGNGVTEVVSGGAKGADSEGEKWAKLNAISIKRFPADWGAHGYAAGPIRNKQMAEYADAAALFPGGRGTLSMAKEAASAGIDVHDFRGIEKC
ncbi:MAG: SLOG family protein [Spongiibacteraceae bacterium]